MSRTSGPPRACVHSSEKRKKITPVLLPSQKRT